MDGLTMCGYFVGYKMNVAELRYNLNRMWGKYGFKEIHDNGNGIFLFRFSKKDGMDFVVEMDHGL